MTARVSFLKRRLALCQSVSVTRLCHRSLQRQSTRSHLQRGQPADKQSMGISQHRAKRIGEKLRAPTLTRSTRR